MKTFMTVLMASIAWSLADVSHLPAYNYQVQTPLHQQQLSQAQYQPFRPSPQYLPAIQQQPQSYQQQYSQPIVPQYEQQLQQPQFNNQQQYSSQLAQQLPQLQQQQLQQQNLALPQPQQQKYTHVLPMPSGLTVVTPPKFKTGHRYRPRVRIANPIKKPIISKSFFIHSAPEESDDEIQHELSQIAQQPHKHYNVLFVKAPTQTNKASALSFAKSLNEERTVVYVLSKKTSAADLQEALTDQPQILNKPEVFFIKYRTPEEAANAQRQIQSQYDSLGGSTTITDEGEAPVTSVVGSLDVDEEENEIEEESANQQLAQEQLQQQPQEQQQEQFQQQQQPQQQQYGAVQSQLNQLPGNNQYLPPRQF